MLRKQSDRDSYLTVQAAVLMASTTQPGKYPHTSKQLIPVAGKVVAYVESKLGSRLTESSARLLIMHCSVMVGLFIGYTGVPCRISRSLLKLALDELSASDKTSGIVWKVPHQYRRAAA